MYQYKNVYILWMHECMNVKTCECEHVWMFSNSSPVVSWFGSFQKVTDFVLGSDENDVLSPK